MAGTGLQTMPAGVVISRPSCNAVTKAWTLELPPYPVETGMVTRADISTNYQWWEAQGGVTFFQSVPWFQFSQDCKLLIALPDMNTRDMVCLSAARTRVLNWYICFRS